MGNEERTNIVPTILLKNVYGSLPNELFNLNEKEDSKAREEDEKRNFSETGEKQVRRKSVIIMKENRAPREIRIIIFAV